MDRKKFSNKWKSSSRKSKQKRYRMNAPSHVRRKMMSAHLSKELRKKYSRRSIPARKGDTVKVMRGSFKKKTGKILEVDMRRMKVYIDGMQRGKQDGSKVNVPFEPSNLMITELNLDDRKRTAIVEAKAGGKK